MKRPCESVRDIKDRFVELTLWGENDFRKAINTSRYEVFEELFSGLAGLEKRVADEAALEHLKKATALAEEAREFYRAGNYRGGVIIIQQSDEQFLEVKLRGKNGKIESVPLV